MLWDSTVLLLLACVLCLRLLTTVKANYIGICAPHATSQREWRCKWSPDADKAALSAAQDALTEILAEVSLSS